jgi:hypothetical protein
MQGSVLTGESMEALPSTKSSTLPLQRIFLRLLSALPIGSAHVISVIEHPIPSDPVSILPHLGHPNLSLLSIQAR